MSLTKSIKTALPILVLVAFVALGISQIKAERELKLQNSIELQSREAELIDLNNRYQDVLNEKAKTQKERDEKAKEIEKLEKERERLQRELQAKRAREAREAEKARRTATLSPQRVSAGTKPSGDCHDWMRQAGITDMVNGYELIMRESSCNPNAVNPSSGACGIAQALPCSKKPGQWSDPVNSMRWMQQYVLNRYGSWAKAVQFHDANNWY